MPVYIVTRKEVWDALVRVTAETPEEAKNKVAHGDGEELTSEYNRTLDVDLWTVDEVKGE